MKMVKYKWKKTKLDFLFISLVCTVFLLQLYYKFIKIRNKDKIILFF